MSPVNVVIVFLFTLTSSSQGMSSPHSPREMLRSPLFFKPNATHPQIQVNNVHGNSSLSKGTLRKGRNIFNLIGFITGYRAGQGLAYQSQNNLNLLGRILQMSDGKIGDANSEFYPEFPSFPTSPSYPPMAMPYWYPTFPNQIQQQYPPQHAQQYPPQHPPQFPPQYPPQYPQQPYPQFPSPRPPAIGGSGSNVPPTAPAPVNQQQIVNIHEPLGSDPPQDNYQEIRDDNRQQIVNNLQDPNNEYSDNASPYEDAVVTRESYDNRGRNQAENGLRQDKITFPDTVFGHGLPHTGPINNLGHVYDRLNTNSKKAQSTSKQNNDVIVQMQTPAKPSGPITSLTPSQESQNPKKPAEKPENEPENEDDGDEEDNTDDDENEDDNDNDDTEDETESTDNGGENTTEDETENTTDMPTDATTMENMRPPQIQKPDSPPGNTIPETTQPTPGNGYEEHHIPPGSYGHGDLTGNISITISPLHQYEHYDDNPHHVYNPSFPYKFNNYIPTAYQDHPIKIVKPLNEEHKLWDYYKYNGDHFQTGNTYENEHQSHEPFLHNDEHEAYSPYVYNSHDNYKRGLS